MEPCMASGSSPSTRTSVEHRTEESSKETNLMEKGRSSGRMDAHLKESLCQESTRAVTTLIQMTLKYLKATFKATSPEVRFSANSQ
jgi:hypothetical protein